MERRLMFRNRFEVGPDNGGGFVSAGGISGIGRGVSLAGAGAWVRVSGRCSRASRSEAASGAPGDSVGGAAAETARSTAVCRAAICSSRGIFSRANSAWSAATRARSCSASRTARPERTKAAMGRTKMTTTRTRTTRMTKGSISGDQEFERAGIFISLPFNHSLGHVSITFDPQNHPYYYARKFSQLAQVFWLGSGTGVPPVCFWSGTAP